MSEVPSEAPVDPDLDYDFDEEALGFGEPQTPDAHSHGAPGAHGAPGSTSPASKFALLIVALGLASLLMQVFVGTWNGTWLGFLSAYGGLCVGAGVYFWTSAKDTPAGIRHDGVFFDKLLARGSFGWFAGVSMTGLYILLYWYPELLGQRSGEAPVGLVGTVDALALAFVDAHASQWFLYGILYSAAICVFGVRVVMKYRHNRYQMLRTLSVAFFQLVFAWFLPNLLVRLQKPYMEFNGVWPLKQNYLWPEKAAGEFASAGSFGTFLLVFAIVGVIATPVLTYFYGKRWYCSWVCGCGGLAETLGDPWRQLSDKSTRAWNLERVLIHSVLGLVLLTTLMLWADYATTGNLYGSWSGGLRQWYGFYIGAVFSGVVGVGFYPLLGNRVWCRFGCPQAAILGLFQRLFSRFRITTNGGQCMSCGNCSTYCEMGIDVRAYAQRGENIVRASCVGCGVCAAVCPRGVLKLETGASEDRYAGAENPLQALRDSIAQPDIYGYKAWSCEQAPSAGTTSTLQD